MKMTAILKRALKFSTATPFPSKATFTYPQFKSTEERGKNSSSLSRCQWLKILSSWLIWDANIQ